MTDFFNLTNPEDFKAALLRLGLHETNSIHGHYFYPIDDCRYINIVLKSFTAQFDWWYFGYNN